LLEEVKKKRALAMEVAMQKQKINKKQRLPRGLRIVGGVTNLFLLTQSHECN
jgi:hypothetical protein